MQQPVLQNVDNVEQHFIHLRRQRSYGTSLRTQILSILASVMLAVCLVTGAVFHFVVERNVERQNRDHALHTSRALFASLSSLPDPTQPPAHLYTTLRNTHIMRITLFDKNLQPILSLSQAGPISNPTSIAPLPNTRLALHHTTFVSPYTLASGERVLSVLLSPRPDDFTPNPLSIEVLHSVEHTEATKFSLRLWLLLLLLCSVIVISTMGYLMMTRFVVHPLQHIAETARSVALGDFSKTLPVRRSRELGQLADEFNSMISEIQKSRQKLESKIEALHTANTSLATLNGQLETTNRTLALTQESLIRSEKLASVGQMAAGVAHEIGNPLAAVLGYLDLLSDDDLDHEDRADILQRCEHLLQRIDSIIRDLLDYARADSTDLQPTPLNETVEHTLHLLKALPRFRDIALHTDLNPNLPPALFRDARLQQVLINLLFNAADALAQTPQASIIIKTRLATIHDPLPDPSQPHAHYQVLEVRDNGPGIPDEVLPRIFDPFYTTKDPGEGTGLGLAICQSILESFSGGLFASSSLHGAVMTVVLFNAPLSDDPVP